MPPYADPAAQPVARRLGWGAVLVLAAFATAQVVQGEWTALASQLPYLGLVILLLAAAPAAPPAVALVPAVVALVNATGEALGLFGRVEAWDEILHTASGFAVVLPLAVLAHVARLPGFRRGGLPLVAAATVLGLVIGLAWEALESTFLDLRVPDTVWDLILDTLGAFAAGLLAAVLAARRSRHP